MIRKRQFSDRLDPYGLFDYELIRKGHIIVASKARNGIVTAAKTALLEAWFNNGTRSNAWSIGLIDNASFTALQETDTLASHSGWIEFQAYTDVNISSTLRAIWNKTTAANKQITNTTVSTFNFTADGQVYGIFLTTDNIKGAATSGKIIWSTAAFSAPLSVEDGDQLKVSYTLST